MVTKSHSATKKSLHNRASSFFNQSGDPDIPGLLVDATAASSTYKYNRLLSVTLDLIKHTIIKKNAMKMYVWKCADTLIY